MASQSGLTKLRRKGDAEIRVKDARETDIVIPIMGPTGVGKSTFINNLLGRPAAGTSDSFESCTQALEHFFIHVPADFKSLRGRRIVLVDTPGFDDTYMDDSEILRRIAVWLGSAYGAKMKIGGVVYLYAIYPNRMTRNDRANLHVFRKLCGEGALSRVILGTTKWSICPPKTGESREKELRDTFWSKMLENGSKMIRIENGHDSAWNAIGKILKSLDENALLEAVNLDIQTEIMSKYKSIPNTAAGKELRKKLLELLKEQKKAQGNSQQLRDRLAATSRQLKELQIPISHKILSFFGLA